MAIMAIDHTRDFFHSAAGQFAPENLAQTTTAIFLTRWITHFCAPVFVFTAGVSAWLWAARGGRTQGDLARYLLTRGLWLIVVDATIMQLALFFNVSFSLIVLTTLWALGCSMVALSGLIYLPRPVLIGVSAAIICLHNATDHVPLAAFGSLAPGWALLHQQILLPLLGRKVVFAYPVLPWIGVMAAGYACGPYFAEPEKYRRRLGQAGAAVTAAFFVVRGLNVYGNPQPWQVQRSPVFTVLSFLNCAKYPPSLDFLLMTIGPALLIYSVLPRTVAERNPLLVFGRVPLFYFLGHIAVLHIMAILLATVRFGHAEALLTAPPFRPEFGYGLGGVYLAWLIVLLLMYPICLWYANVKRQRGPESWLRYL